MVTEVLDLSTHVYRGKFIDKLPNYLINNQREIPFYHSCFLELIVHQTGTGYSPCRIRYTESGLYFSSK